MIQQSSFRHAYILTAITLITVMVFVSDSLTTFGLVLWVLYLIALALTVFQSNPALPLIAGAVQIALIFFGYWVKPAMASELIPFLNRLGGASAITAVALMARRVILERLHTQQLLWLQGGQARVSESLIGERELGESANNVLSVLSNYLQAQIGVLYRFDRGALTPAGAYGCSLPKTDVASSGLAMEVVKRGDIVLLDDVPDGYLQVSTPAGSHPPRSVLLAPITSNKRVVGVIELGFLARTADLERARKLMLAAAEAIGVSVQTVVYRENLKELLEETQRQSEELQVQQEELRVSNEELEEQGRALRESQARLENQHAELEQTNVQLEEHTQRLARQKEDLLKAQRAMEQHATEMNRANQYKSEFLANMSHELRTPLNSSLILAQILSGPQYDSLSDEQRRDYARTIHDSNNDLLHLINDILDLSKIEAGHVELHAEIMSLASVVEPLRHMFDPIAAQKQVGFVVDIAPGAPATLETDRTRLAQILKNLLSNAFKFTSSGEVCLRIEAAGAHRIAFRVRDSGIGIEPEQQAVIFEAFRQADGTTSRKYGGTGLGLSISRELARLLDGEITVSSEPGKGSLFTVEVAVALPALDAAAPAVPAGHSASHPTSAMDRPSHVASRDVLVRDPSDSTPAAEETLLDEAASAALIASFANSGRRSILLIEDDERFIKVLVDLAGDLDFDCAVATTGGQALIMAREIRPSGILLDVNLPDQSGLAVLEQLKRDPATRHIPIHMMSVEDHIQTALQLGAIGYALKPMAREELIQAFSKVEERLAAGIRHVLVIEDDSSLRNSIAELLRAPDVEITPVGTAAEAMAAVADSTFDCVVMDLMLPDASGYDLLEQMAQDADFTFPPVIVYTGRSLTRDEEQRLRRYSRSIIIKGAKSPERLLDEVTLFLHRVESELPPDQQKLLLQARQRDTVLENRSILLVEDDVRNIFALSSVLEPLGAKLLIARNGVEALDALQEHTDIDLVLMDLMMPEMDGLTAMRHIRARDQWRNLPIIALTAKAMVDDRKACLEAGANDYIAKPIDVAKLVSLCRVWMPK